jgi:predicted transposase/invertase (TIGR01784 family)
MPYTKEMFMKEYLPEYYEGLQKAKHEKEIEIAKNMLKKGSDIDFIAEVTGLSVKEIKELSEK